MNRWRALMSLAMARWLGCGAGVGTLGTGVGGKAEGTLRMVWSGGVAVGGEVQGQRLA
jgi:hypothetical protein